MATQHDTATATMDNGELPEGWAAAMIGAAFDVNPRKAAADALPARAPVTFVPMPAVDADSGTIMAPLEREFAAVRRAGGRRAGKRKTGG